MTCANCKHFLHKNVGEGECHRMPPTGFLLMGPGGQTKILGLFVPTKPTNSCGEHAVKLVLETTP